MKMSRRSVITGLSLFSGGLFVRMVQGEEEVAYPGVLSDFGGFACYTFAFEGRTAKIAVPKAPREQSQVGQKPWIWRARFWGHEPQTDFALLQRGYHVVTIDATPLMGSPKSVELWQKFYQFVTQTFGLSKRVVLEGMSRGGLYVMNWAIAYPDQVESIYIDNPVLDFRTWPGGQRGGARSDNDWADVLKAYGLSEEEALAYEDGPLNEARLRKLAEKKVPILVVCGDADHVVPYEQNTKILEERYSRLGGPIQVIVKPGNDHHPHSLPDPTPIVEFVEKAANRE